MPRTNINSSTLDSVLENWQNMPIPEQPKLVTTFSDGLNHQAHLISSGDHKVVLKLFNNPSPIAISAQKLAANHKLAPKILYVNQADDVVLMEYIDVQTITPPLNIEDISSLGNALKKLHSIASSSYQNYFSDFDLLEHYNAYLAKIDKDGSIIKVIHRELTPIINVFLSDNTDRCFCHNDLVNENIFVNNNKLKIIDWEYTQINNPFFDLATLIYSLNLDQQQVTQLINTYDQSWLNKLNTPVYFSALISMLWCDILWHLARGENLESPSLKSKLADLDKFKHKFHSLAS